MNEPHLSPACFFFFTLDQDARAPYLGPGLVKERPVARFPMRSRAVDGSRRSHRRSVVGVRNQLPRV